MTEMSYLGYSYLLVCLWLNWSVMFTSASSVSVTVTVCPSPVIEASAMSLKILLLQGYSTFGKNFHET